VVSNHDSALPEKLNFSGGWLEIVLATDEAVFCSELIKLWNGERSIFCPKNSTLSGRTKLSVSWGVPIMPSTNLICMEVEGKVRIDRFKPMNTCLNHIHLSITLQLYLSCDMAKICILRLNHQYGFENKYNTATMTTITV